MAWSDFSKRIRSANARLNTVRRIYGADSSIYKRLSGTVERATGSKFFSKKALDGGLRNIAKVDRALSYIENSVYTSKEGRKSIGEKARRTFERNRMYFSEEQQEYLSQYSDTAYQKIYDIFENSSFSKIQEAYKGQSAEYVDAILTAFESDDYSVRQMRNKIKYFTEHLDEFGKGETALEKFRDFL